MGGGPVVVAGVWEPWAGDRGDGGDQFVGRINATKTDMVAWRNPTKKDKVDQPEQPARHRTQALLPHAFGRNFPLVQAQLHYWIDTDFFRFLATVSLTAHDWSWILWL